MIPCCKYVKSISRILGTELKDKDKLPNGYESLKWFAFIMWWLYFPWYSWVYLKPCIKGEIKIYNILRTLWTGGPPAPQPYSYMCLYFVCAYVFIFCLCIVFSISIFIF